MFVYTPIYRCNYTDFLINFAPTLTFFQSLVYQADEEIRRSPAGQPTIRRPGLGLRGMNPARRAEAILGYWTR